jgi:hypothetical protein
MRRRFPRWTAQLPGLAVVLAGLVQTTALQAQAPPAAATPERAVYSPRSEPMTFRLVTGQGPGGATQWVEAAGQIRLETPRVFETFKSANRLEGLPVVLDSTGGSVIGAMIVGRAMRALNLRASVGRTIETDRGSSVRSRDVLCASACVLLLAAGKERSVASDARIGLHMFGLSVNAEGQRAREEITLRDVEEAQRTMAAHAVFLHEMGVHPRLLTLMTQASFRGALRILTPAEIRETQLASVSDATASPPETTSRWSLSPPSSSPQLIRSQQLLSETGRIVTHELVLECDGVKGFFWTTYSTSVAGNGAPPPQAIVQTVRLDTGGWDYIFRAPGRGLAAKPGSPLWMRRSVPEKVFADAIANGKLRLDVSEGAKPPRMQDFHDLSFGRLFGELAKRCDARPNRVTMGGNPRR